MLFDFHSVSRFQLFSLNFIYSKLTIIKINTEKYQKNTFKYFGAVVKFLDFFTFQHNFPSPQVNRNQIITTKRLMYLLLHKLSQQQELRFLGNQKTSKNSLKSFELMASPQLATQKPNLDSCARKLRNIFCKKFQRNTYFT